MPIERPADYDPETGRMGKGPSQLFLEVTSRCNLACVHCSTDFGRPDVGPPPGDMSSEVLDAVTPWIRSAVAINLNGVGEPLIAREFPRIVERCRGTGLVSFNTNGVALDAEMARFLVAQGVDQIAMSIDGTDANHAIRGVPYATLRKRLQMLQRIRDDAGAKRPELGIACSLMRRTLPEIPRLLEDLLASVKLRFVHVHPTVVFYEGLRGEDQLPREETEAILGRAQSICDAHACELVVLRTDYEADERNREPESTSPRGSFSEQFGCIDPFRQLTVQASGNVLACLGGRMPEKSVLEYDRDEIWNGTWYRDLRRRLIAGNPPDACRDCPNVTGRPVDRRRHLREGVHHSREAAFAKRNGRSVVG